MEDTADGSQPMGILTGKAVVITGSGRGIGAACAKRVALQGASLVINDVNGDGVNETVAAIQDAGGTAAGCVADITSWDAAARLIQHCLERFGKIDGLVNNAGLAHIAGIAELDPLAAQALINVNVMGTLFCTAHAVKPMLAQKSGSIINITSGAHMGIPRLGVYAASKGAVASMVYSWALELAGTGVRVNALSPVAGGTGMSPADPRNQLPEANSPVLEYLLSDLSAHVNGQIIRIDKEELHLYAHPTLLLPPAVRDRWDAHAIAEAFDADFKNRQVACGVMGSTTLPVKIEPAYWKGRAGP
jgi:NAD(P)-dependent dehydrogenase (short-subunit alcohol dehydrogenase family)